ncbi:type II toxin-antitoxin system YafQ family toxin [Ereboglobus luteus]|uniref:Type II toxin-antitoxin system mRNA interferase toxin, RelE/StbE family n=1 Tax=Ereboglobus luteus TaxID=1796921 RepID=A0A2U8E0E3_9BACT|nr:type II toxin-antitoxin system YafQ family toxin [Ereboglobus luteus]AWI08052.1 hypothetical protein CKA38_01130 [Ereboglobus luteus]
MNYNFTKQFRKDYARRIEGTRLESDFEKLFDLLVTGQPLPPVYRDHALVGNWKGHRDCHLRSDMVLVYKIEGDTIVFTRINTHSELFG